MAGSENNGHRKRLKERYAKFGIDAFEEHETLELLLFYAYPRVDTNKIAHTFLNEYGSLANLCNAGIGDLVKRLDITENVAILITLLPAIYKKYSLSFKNDTFFNTTSDVGKYAVNLFHDKIKECFYILCLDGKKRILNTCLISEGTVTETSIYTRNIVETALFNNAVNIVLVHNHPKGNAKPSKADINSTILIINALKYVTIRVLDHIIVSDNKYFSFCENKTIDFKV